MRSKAYVPAPNSYNVAKDLNNKTNILTSKSPRVTHAEELINQVKKDKFPDVGTYKKSFSTQDESVKGCFKYSSDRCGYIDECGVKGKESAPYYKKNYARIDAKMRTTTIYKASPPKPV